MTRRATNGPKTGKDRRKGGEARKNDSAKPSPLTWSDARCETIPDGWHVMMPTPVSGNRIWRKGGGRTYEVKQHKDDKTQAALTFRHVPPILGPVAVRVVWVRSRRSGDVDNFAVKPVLDILKGVLFGDDADVVEIRAIRSDDPVRRPGVYVWVFAANADDVAAAGWAA